MTKAVKNILIVLAILIIIWLMGLDTTLVGENFLGKAFFILFGLGLLFIEMDKKDDTIRYLQKEIEEKNNYHKV